MVFAEDECHYLWGDILGYVWGKKGKRSEALVKNEKIRQTYFGCVNIANGLAFVKRYASGNGENAVRFLRHVVQKVPSDKRILILWDKATYHTCKEVKAYLKEINQGLSKKDWKLTLELLPTAAPEENPIETVWLKAKNHVRNKFNECNGFADVKRIFEEYIESSVFDFEKMKTFGDFF